MLLSNADITRLERVGYHPQQFVRYDRQGYARLQNRHGRCIFYDQKEERCTVYHERPEGCRIYPVVYSEYDGVIVDPLCPVKNIVSKKEVRRKGEKVIELLRRIDAETTLRPPQNRQ